MKSLPLLEPSAPSESSVRPDARYRIEGMDCASCACTLERVVAGVEGVAECSRLVRLRIPGALG